MPWLKLDDLYFDHPKVARAGGQAALLDIAGMIYCARHLTDGYIPAGMVPRLADIDDPRACAARLVAVGRWEESEDGYLVHDYLDYNPSRAKALADRAKDAARKRGGNPGGISPTGDETPRAAPRGVQASRTPVNPADFPSIETISRNNVPGLPPGLHADSDTALIAQLRALAATAPGNIITGQLDWQPLYDAHTDDDGQLVRLAEAFHGLTALDIEDAVALDLARTRNAACLDWLDHPDRYKHARHPAGLLVKRLRALPASGRSGPVGQ